MVRRLLLKLGCFVPIAAAVAVVNWTVDPAFVFSGHGGRRSEYEYTRLVVNDLLAGRPHKLQAPCDLQFVFQRIFETRPQIQMLALGSSIAMPIHGELFPGTELSRGALSNGALSNGALSNGTLSNGTFFNGAVNSGSLEEGIAVYETACESGLHLKRLVIELDGSPLGKRKWPILENFAPSFHRACERMQLDAGQETESDHAPTLVAQLLLPRQDDQTPPLLEPYDQLFSPRYLQFSLRSLALSWFSHDERNGSSMTPVYAPDEQIEIYPDGSVQWSPKACARTPADLVATSEAIPTQQLNANWLKLAEPRCRLFESFVLAVARKNVEVDLLLIPPNPILFEKAEQECRRESKPLPYLAANNYLRSFARRNRIPVYGTLDPREAGVRPEDYVDFIHPRRESMARLVRRFFAHP